MDYSNNNDLRPSQITNEPTVGFSARVSSTAGQYLQGGASDSPPSQQNPVPVSQLESGSVGGAAPATLGAQQHVDQVELAESQQYVFNSPQTQ